MTETEIARTQRVIKIADAIGAVFCGLMLLSVAVLPFLLIGHVMEWYDSRILWASVLFSMGCYANSVLYQFIAKQAKKELDKTKGGVE